MPKITTAAHRGVDLMRNGDTVVVTLLPDWRGMGASTLGVYALPLGERDSARLLELGVDPDAITEALRPPRPAGCRHVDPSPEGDRECGCPDELELEAWLEVHA